MGKIAKNADPEARGMIVIGGDTVHIIGMLHDMTEFLLVDENFTRFMEWMQSEYKATADEVGVDFRVNNDMAHDNLTQLLDKLHRAMQ